MQRDENLVYINNRVNGQQIDAIHMGYRQTGAVYTCRSGSVQIQPDRPPISVRARIGSNSMDLCISRCVLQEEEAHFMRLVSVLHDLLVCDTTSKDKRDELQKYVHSTSTLQQACHRVYAARRLSVLYGVIHVHYIGRFVWK